MQADMSRLAWQEVIYPLDGSAGKRRLDPALHFRTKPHLVRGDEAKSLVEAPPLIGRVKDDATDAPFRESVQQRAHQCFRDALSPPLGEHRCDPMLGTVPVRAPDQRREPDHLVPGERDG